MATFNYGYHRRSGERTMAETQNGRLTTGCAAFETADGDVVFYDRENANAWIQSDYAIDFDDVRASGPAE